jgi:hypothetical protein
MRLCVCGRKENNEQEEQELWIKAFSVACILK